jgi:hypothetical protein
MMNAPLVLAESRAMAEGLLSDAALDDAGRVRAAYLRCYSRPPTQNEGNRALAFIARYEEAQADRALDAAEARIRAWQALCRTLLAANELIYIE